MCESACETEGVLPAAMAAVAMCGAARAQDEQHKPEDLDDVRKFIDLYKPHTMTLPTTMPAAGSE